MERAGKKRDNHENKNFGKRGNVPVEQGKSESKSANENGHRAILQLSGETQT